MEITLDKVRKCLSAVDAGLSSGLGNPIPGQMCVEAAICYGLGLKHSDDPGCVAPSLRALKITLNDSQWSSPKARAKGLRRLSLIQLGSKDSLNEILFSKKVSEYTIKNTIANILRVLSESKYLNKNKQSLLDAALRCEKEGTADAARAASDAASYAASYAASAASYAASAASAASDAARAASDAARAASYAASAASDAASAASDKILADFAEGVVQILIEMNVPGVQWLYLTEE